MKTFDVFKDSGSDYQAVKQGYSWPALFFTLIWLFIKKLWIQALVVALIGFFSVLIQNRSDSPIPPLVNIIVALVVGAMGNKWRKTNLLDRGFKHVLTIDAETPDAAISAAANLPDEVEKDDFNEKWITLVENDPNLKACVEDLKRYGIQAIEKFKKMYRVIEDKQQLSVIVDQIKKEIEDDVGQKAALMNRYGISFENNQFVYSGYRYDNIEDAVNYAKQKH